MSQQLASSVCFFLFGAYLMGVAGYITDKIYFAHFCRSSSSPLSHPSSLSVKSALPDIFDRVAHKVYFFITAKKWTSVGVVDALVFAMAACFLLCLFGNRENNGLRTLIASRFFLVWGFVCYLRTLCLTTTVLPSYHEDICSHLESAARSHKSAPMMGLMYLLGPVTKVYPMADYMFSGHASSITCLYYFTVFQTLSRTRWYFAKFLLVTALYFVAVMSVSLTKLHYSADVLVGVMLTTFTYIAYCLAADRSRYKNLTFPYTFIRWIEEQSKLSHHTD